MVRGAFFEGEAQGVVFLDFIDHAASKVCGKVVHGILDFNFDKMLGRFGARDKVA